MNSAQDLAHTAHEILQSLCSFCGRGRDWRCCRSRILTQELHLHFVGGWTTCNIALPKPRLPEIRPPHICERTAHHTQVKAHSIRLIYKAPPTHQTKGLALTLPAPEHLDDHRVILGQRNFPPNLHAHVVLLQIHIALHTCPVLYHGREGDILQAVFPTVALNVAQPRHGKTHLLRRDNIHIVLLRHGTIALRLQALSHRKESGRLTDSLPLEACL